MTTTRHAPHEPLGVPPSGWSGRPRGSALRCAEPAAARLAAGDADSDLCRCEVLLQVVIGGGSGRPALTLGEECIEELLQTAEVVLELRQLGVHAITVAAEGRAGAGCSAHRQRADTGAGV